MQTLKPVPVSGTFLFAAPHRAMFLSGGVVLLIAFVIWMIELTARAGLIGSIDMQLPAGWVHALLVGSGVFPFFMFGFLLTAMPRWQGVGDLPQASWLRAWRVLASGWGVVIAGLWLPGLLLVGLVVVFIGWSMIAMVLWRVAQAPRDDVVHARTVMWAILAGLPALAAWVVCAVTGDGRWARIAINVAFWWSLLPVFIAVSHRMIPFFSANVIADYVVIRPRWALAVLVGASFVHGALALTGLGVLSWITDAPAAAVALWLSWRWRIRPALSVPLLGMLHIGFAWLGMGFLLLAVQAAGASAGYFWLGLAPLHAIGIGFFASILLAMVSRVTLGHSGRPLKADRLTWGLFLALQVVVVLRITADLVPGVLSTTVMWLAAVGWLAIFTAWSVRYLPIYWRPRVDGKPG